MQEEIAKNGMKNITVRVINSVYWVEGVVTSKTEEALVRRIAEGFLPPALKSLFEKNSDRVLKVKGRAPIEYFFTINEAKQKRPPEKLIKVSAQFVELSKSYGKVFSFKWAPTISEDGSAITVGKTQAGELGTVSSGTLSATISNLFPKLLSARDAGYARVIQSGMVIFKDGKGGDVKKSSTEPFSVGTGEFTRASNAEFGLNFSVKGRAVEEENVELSINLGVSLANGFTSDGDPKTTTNSIQTELVIKSKNSAVIGGVVQNSTITGYDRNSPDGQTEVTNGSLFFNFLRSKKFQTSKNQYVVFVTPEIIQSASVGTDEIKRKFRRRAR